MSSRLARFGLIGLFLAVAPLSSCSEDGSQADVEPAISVDGAVPQDGAPPTGDPEDDARPQIVALHAPETVFPGQIATVRLLTNFEQPELISGVAMVVEGQDGWHKIQTPVVAASAGEEAVWAVEFQVSVGVDAPGGQPPPISFALLGENDVAGIYVEWAPVVDGDGVVCPDDADCGERVCGPDPVCGSSCGMCTDGLACSPEGSCEPSSVDNCTPIVTDSFDRADASEPGNTEFPGDPWLVTNGMPIIKDQAFTEGDGGLDAFAAIATGPVDERTARLRFAFVMGGGGNLSVTFNNSTGFLGGGLGVGVASTGAVAINRDGESPFATEIPSFSGNETYYVELAGVGETVELDVSVGNYASLGGTSVAELEAPVSTYAGTQYLVAAVSDGQFPASILEVYLDDCS